MLDDAEVEQSVLEYLAERPNAMDTFEGISSWWVRMQRVRFAIETLKRVLDRLTDCGVLERLEILEHPETLEQRSGRRTLYRLKS